MGKVWILAIVFMAVGFVSCNDDEQILEEIGVEQKMVINAEVTPNDYVVEINTGVVDCDEVVAEYGRCEVVTPNKILFFPDFRKLRREQGEGDFLTHDKIVTKKGVVCELQIYFVGF